MKKLRIKGGIAYYLTKCNEYKKIIDIGKEDVLFILDKIFETEADDIEYDVISEENTVHNDAERIIYENLLNKFILFQKKREDLKTQLDSVFSEFN